MDTQKLLNKYNNREPLSALESIVIISKSREAAAELASLRERAEKAEALLNALPEYEIELAREVWGNTNTRIVLEKRRELEAALKGDA